MAEFWPRPGQWVGRTKGNPDGKIIIDLDPSPEGSVGIASLFPEASGLPASAAPLLFSAGQATSEQEQEVSHFAQQWGRVLLTSDLRRDFPDSSFPSRVKVTCSMSSEREMLVHWSTDVGTFGDASLFLSPTDNISKIAPHPEVASWSAFKEHVAKLNFRDFVFRGQSRSYALRTTFHRSGRKVLQKYVNSDIPQLHRALTGRTKHLFDISKPDQLGAFLSLAQHHGFPTPLLDWTYSPFVAARFAFARELERPKGNEMVRVFSLNKRAFETLSQFQTVSFAPPHFSILEALAIENDRIIPQQGLLTLTNLCDVEQHVIDLQTPGGLPFLMAFDIPYSDRKNALNDLSMMGITRSTLFPSIESI